LASKSGSGDAFQVFVVREADALLVEDAPQLAAADGWHHPPRDEVRTQLGQAPGGERLTPLDRAGEGHLHDPGALIGIDPARTAPAPARVQGCEALRVEGVDELGHMGRARAVQHGDLRHALALEGREEQHRPVLHRRVPAAPRELEEEGRLLVAQLTDEEFGPAGHRHLLCSGGPWPGLGGVRLPPEHYESGH